MQHRFLQRTQSKLDICRHSFTLATYNDGSGPKGKIAYQFKMTTPEELPPSVVAKSVVMPGLLNLIRYTLVAELG